ncbi:lipopolysaccharide biosynthesis protein [Microbacterium capsulatum]|uniref:Lipopolysaccharide biosynthesis protein n=1 Tax=Microbacterium capsulatum TaxID=3041921 RepID=A0ABU0XHV8_9MICO|nr:lipopolysaccharide biosynthesis protein [Microbacterium sp. ASV81]MDQ4214264.1 lipopolysaccharide biosynthesis protein [Microbacterium sp. ASV81]
MTKPSIGKRAEAAVGEATGDVSGRAASGVLWLTVQKWAVRLLGFVTIAVLTRLLSPADFGTVAAASTVLPFFFLLADLGFAAYIVQVDKSDQRMLSTAFWFSLGAGGVLCATLFGLAPVLAVVFHDDGVRPVLQALSLWVVLTAAGSVPMALLRRGMRFGVLAGQGAAAAGVAQVVAMIMAFSGFGVWALVAQSLVAPAITTVLAWITSRWRPTFAFSRAEFRVMGAFGGQVLGVEFVAMLRAWGEAAVISAVLGIGAFGYMTIAQRLVQVVQDLTGSAIVPVTQVAFAKIRDDEERLLAAYLRALRLTYFALSLPLTMLAVAAPLVVPIVFGRGWDQSYPVAQILALAGILSVGAWLDNGLFYGVGRPGTWFVYALVIDGITFGTTAALSRLGLVVIAWGFLGVCVVATVTRWFLTARVLGARARVVAGPFVFVAVAVVGSAAAGWGVRAATVALPSWAALLLIGCAVLAVHLLATRLLAPRVLPDALALLGRSRIGARIRGLSRMRTARGGSWKNRIRSAASPAGEGEHT